MELPLKVKTEPDTELLTIDEVFLYKITNKEHQLTRHAHKASTWTVNDPDWHGTLKLITAGPKHCQVLFESRKGTIFGETVIKKYPSPHAFQKVVDSSRYFTLKIRKWSSLSAVGEDILYGIGFMSRTDSSSVTEALESYFTNPVKEEIKPKDGEIKIKVEKEEDTPAVQVPEEVPKEKSYKFQYNCSVCQTSCSTTEVLKEHIETAHTDEAGSILFYCDAPDCGKRFLSELTLYGHKVTAHNEAPKRKKIYWEKDEKEALENAVKFSSSSSGIDAAGSSDHNQSAPSHTIITKNKRKRIRKKQNKKGHKVTATKRRKIHSEKDENEAVQNSVKLSVAGELVEPVTIMTNSKRRRMRRKQFRSSTGVPYQEKGTRIFLCHICPKRCFSTYDTPTLHKHWKTIHKIRTPFLCELCCLIFSSEKYRSEHMDKEHFPCKPCTAVS